MRILAIVYLGANQLIPRHRSQLMFSVEGLLMCAIYLLRANNQKGREKIASKGKPIIT